MIPTSRTIAMRCLVAAAAIALADGRSASSNALAAAHIKAIDAVHRACEVDVAFLCSNDGASPVTREMLPWSFMDVLSPPPSKHTMPGPPPREMVATEGSKNGKDRGNPPQDSVSQMFDDLFDVAKNIATPFMMGEVENSNRRKPCAQRHVDMPIKVTVVQSSKRVPVNEHRLRNPRFERMNQSRRFVDKPHRERKPAPPMAGRESSVAASSPSSWEAIDHIFDDMISMLLSDLSGQEKRKAVADDIQIIKIPPPPIFNHLSSMQSPETTSENGNASSLAMKLAKHSEHVSTNDENVDPTKSRFARRLSAAFSDSTDYSFSSVKSSGDVRLAKIHDMDMKMSRLAYGCKVDKCLWKNHFQLHRVAPTCGASLDVVTATYDALRQESTSDEEMEMFNQLVEQLCSSAVLAVLICTAASLVVLLAFVVHAHKYGRRGGGHGRFRLMRKIVGTVYSDPSIKEQVERAMGEELGDAPPFPRWWHHVGHMGNKNRGPMGRFCRALPSLTLSFLLVACAITNPGLVLAVGVPSLILMGLYKLARCCCCTGGQRNVVCNDEEIIERGVTSSNDSVVSLGYPGAVGMAKRREANKSVHEMSTVSQIYVAVPM